MKNSMAKNIVILLVTVLLSGGILIFAESKLAFTIKNQAVAQDLGTLQKFFPGVEEFSVVDFVDETGLVKKVYEAKDTGYAYIVENQGYKDKLVFAVALDNEGTIKGYEVTRFNDTDGIGSKIKDEPFVNSIVGKTSTDAFATISGATISCTAIIVGLDAVKDNYNAMKGIVDDGTSTPEVVVPVDPPVELGSSIMIFREVSEKRQGTITDKQIEGDIETYTVTVSGYAVLEGDHGEPIPNTVIIKLNKQSKIILSVEVTVASDTKNIGTQITNATFLDQFKDLSYADETVEADTISGATVSSTSVINAILAAIQASK